MKGSKTKEDVLTATHRAKETYEELRTALPPLLSDYLARQRWFGGKARQIRSTEIADLVPLGDAHFETLLLLVCVTYATGPTETYALPLVCTQEPAGNTGSTELKLHSAARGKDLHLRNALTDDGFLRLLLRTIQQRNVFRGIEGEIEAGSTSTFAVLCDGAADALQPKAIKAEQSNSSIIYGDRLILKFIRRVEHGENPDLEIGRFLTEKKNFSNTPAVAGWLDYKSKNGSKVCMGILQAFVPNVGDAWQFTLNGLPDFWREAKKYSAQTESEMMSADKEQISYRPNLPAGVLDSIHSYLEAVQLLGKRTAELHLALASDAADPAFAPEPFTPQIQNTFKEALRALTERNLSLLRTTIHGLLPELRDKAGDLISRQDEIMRRYDAALSSPIHAMRTRIHGDYHLGQVLYTGSDFVIVDFEGEPARPLSERRAKRSPLQDVAGMLRSFHYAAFSFQLTRPEDMTDSQAKNFDVNAWAEAWYACVADRFLAAYLETVGGASFIPASRDELSSLLRVHLLEKAVYELGYELNNRPTWVAIPVAGILQLLNE